MGWSLPPGKKWSGPPDWAVVDDPDYGKDTPATPAPAPAPIVVPAQLDFSQDDSGQQAQPQRLSFRGSGGNWAGAPVGPAAQPDTSWNTGDSMDDSFDGGGVDYSGSTSQDFAPGMGQYTIGDQTYDINAPGGGGSSLYNASDIYGQLPSSDTNPSYAPNFDFNYTGDTSQVPSPGRGGGGGGGRGFGQPSAGGGYAPQPYNRVSLGQPEHTLYDQYSRTLQGGAPSTLYNRYSTLLQNPAQMSQDPAYQFMYGQGMQAMNRDQWRQRSSLSGGGALEAQQYGQGLASNYMRQMLPMYQQGAGTELQRYLGQVGALGGGSQQELARFMGPAGLLPGYAGVNNQVSQLQGSEAAAQQLIPYYQQMLAGGGGYLGAGAGGGSPSAFSGSGASFGGIGQGYNPRLSPAVLSELSNSGLDTGGMDINTLADEMGWNG